MVPNPARATALVLLSRPPAADTAVRVFDVLGREVARVPLAAGAASATLAVEGWPSGVYIARVTDGDDTRAVRFTVVR